MDSKSDVIMSTTPSTSTSTTSSSSTSSSSSAPISSIYHSISTAHPASTVTHACTGHFTSPDAVNLITVKCTRLEIHRFQQETLEAPISVPIYGRISALRLFRAKGETQDRLLVVTERYKFCVLAYDMKTNEIVTKANGDIRHKMGQPCNSGHNVIIDPLTRLIGLHMYQGIFQAIPIDSRGMLSQEAIDMRLDEIHVHQMTLLHGTTKPTIALIYEDSKQKRFIKSYEVKLKDKTLGEGPWAPSQLENGATWLIPIPTPFGGILIIGEEVISYYTGKQFKMTKIRPAQITAWGMIDSARYLLGDLSGNLHVLVLKHDGNNILSLHLDTVGITSIANTITYLDSGYVHIGSIYGDSQLIKLNAEKNADGNYVDIITTFPNLGSIMDMTVIDLDRQGQGQIVTCSGAYKDGSLRIIRNGIGINEEASIELPGMKGVWSLRPETASPYHKFLVESFVGETRVLAIEDEELGEMEIPGFESTAQTLFCGNVVDNVLLQVTSNSVRLVDCTSLDNIQIWTPPANAHITVAHANTTQLVIATGAILYLLNITNRKVVQDATVTLDYEVSCIDVSPLGDAPSSTVAAIGMWTDISVRILSLPSLKEITRTKLDGQIIPRSVMFVQFEQTCYLLCGLGDGHLYNFEYDMKQQTLQNHKKIALGSQPIALSTFKTKDTIHVFASCDRPTVIYSIHNKLLYSNVNLKDVNYMTPFNAEVFRGCLAFATEESLTIGNIDEIQKLHIRSIPLGEQPTRIAHQSSSHTVCVTTKAYVREDTTGSYGELNHVKLFDDTSMEMIHTMTLDTHESVASIGSIKFDEYYYYVVGTAYVLSDEPEPTHGRLLFYRVIEKKLVSVATIHTKGAVYTLTGFHGKLVCGINSKVQLYDVKTHVTSDGTNLRVTPECSHHGNIIVWSIRTIADFIVVADVTKSVSLLVYKAQTQTIEELSRDYDCNWMTSVEILNDQTYLGTDHAFNIFTLRRNVDAITDEDRARLETVGRYHTGEYINQIQKGSLVMNLPDSDNEYRVVPSHLFGAFSGLIGVIAPLTKSQYTFLSRLETILESVIHGIGGLSHSEWRSFHNERKTETKSNYVDGDLIEMTLELPTNKLQQVATQMNCSVEELTKRVEEATRVH